MTAISLLVVFAGCSPETVSTTSSTAPIEDPTTSSPPDTSSPPGTTSTSTTTTTNPGSTPQPDTTTSQLLVVGDWGSGTLPQGAVAGAMSRHSEDHEVEAILTTGDNFYSDDAEFLIEPYGWSADAGIPFWITWGNHDIETTARVDAINEVFDSPPRWSAREWGGVDVIILDSTQTDSEEQREFLTQSLADSEDPTIVVFHHPVLSCVEHGDAPVMDDWVAEFDEEVFLVLTGHDHTYQRFQDGNVTYVVTGGGGATLQDPTECGVDHPEQLAGGSLHHFLVLDQSDGFTLTALDVNGEVFDQVELELP